MRRLDDFNARIIVIESKLDQALFGTSTQASTEAVNEPATAKAVTNLPQSKAQVNSDVTDQVQEGHNDAQDDDQETVSEHSDDELPPASDATLPKPSVQPLDMPSQTQAGVAAAAHSTTILQEGASYSQIGAADPIGDC